jgi:hypothetical protein
VPAFYKIDKERRLVLSSGSGVVTKDDLMGHQDRLLEDSDFDPSFCQLWNLTQVTEANLKAADVERMARRDVFSPSSRRAIVVAKEDHYGLARMFQIHRELSGEHGIRIFRNLDDGLDWIFSKGQAA